jgi:hypothetical protein
VHRGAGCTGYSNWWASVVSCDLAGGGAPCLTLWSNWNRSMGPRYRGCPPTAVTDSCERVPAPPSPGHGRWIMASFSKRIHRWA